MKRRAVVIGFSLVGCGVSPGVRAGSVAGFGGSTEITQILNNIQLILSYAQEVESYVAQLQQFATQIQQYQNQVTNTLKLPFQIWNSLQTDLLGVANIVRQGQALAYSVSNLATQFENAFPAVTSIPGGFNYKTRYNQWSQSTRDTIKGAILATGKSGDSLATDSGVLDSLKAASDSSAGQVQAIQIGSSVAVVTAQQLIKLRELMLSQANASNAFLSKQELKQSTDRELVEGALNYVNPGNPSYTGFGGGSR